MGKLHAMFEVLFSAIRNSSLKSLTKSILTDPRLGSVIGLMLSRTTTVLSIRAEDYMNSIGA